ncbi:MAG TPA: hypothetical protein VEJ87_07375, partial [Acidimicrobiales bacterium]|nr:hypothetical protein [Acidimicrobiales bacterium]
WFYTTTTTVLVVASVGFPSTFSSASGLRSPVLVAVPYPVTPAGTSFEDHVMSANRRVLSTMTSQRVLALATLPETSAPSPPPGPPPRGKANAYGCQAAINYLSAYAAPGFTFECPGYADGHQAMTCINDPPSCAGGQTVIAIAVPCAAAYMNEASNSWVLTDRLNSPIDPYGYCQ